MTESFLLKQIKEKICMKNIFCKKLNKWALPLEHAPIPGELGQRIKNTISQEAWDNWMGYQTILINEYRLKLFDTKARAFLLAEMHKFLFKEKLPS